MKPRPFALERFFDRYEFSTRYLLCSSDAETMLLRDVLSLEPGAETAFADLPLGYTPARGGADLRACIAALYERVDADGILVHAGAEEPIFNFMNVALDAGDHVICNFPRISRTTRLPKPWAPAFRAGLPAAATGRPIPTISCG